MKEISTVDKLQAVFQRLIIHIHLSGVNKRVQWNLSWTTIYTLFKQKFQLYVDGHDYKGLLDSYREREKSTQTQRLDKNSHTCEQRGHALPGKPLLALAG